VTVTRALFKNNCFPSLTISGDARPELGPRSKINPALLSIDVRH